MRHLMLAPLLAALISAGATVAHAQDRKEGGGNVTGQAERPADPKQAEPESSSHNADSPKPASPADTTHKPDPPEPAKPTSPEKSDRK